MEAVYIVNFFLALNYLSPLMSAARRECNESTVLVLQQMTIRSICQDAREFPHI